MLLHLCYFTVALTPEISCEGDQYGLRVTFTLPAHLKDKCPYQLLIAQGIKVYPVLFTKGKVCYMCSCVCMCVYLCVY